MENRLKTSELIQLVERAERHDSAAIESLYHYIYARMYDMLNRLCADKNDIEDILQEGYTAAFMTLDTLREKGAFYNWLKKIVINKWRVHSRDTRSRLTVAAGHIDGEAIPEEWTEPSAQEIVELSETRRELWNIVSGLPENQRVCVILFYYDEMRLDEIAEALGIPLGSVKSRLYYGRERIRQEMKARGLYSMGMTLPVTPAAPTVGGDSVSEAGVLARVMAALETSASSAAVPAVSGGMGLAARLALSAVALLTAGGLLAGVGGLLRQPPREDRSAPGGASLTQPVSASSSAEALTTTTTLPTTTAATTATTTTTAPLRRATFDSEVTGEGVVITRYTGSEKDVVIPGKIDGVPVIAIGNGAFSGSRVTETVVLPASVRRVEANAFRECRNLRSVSLGGTETVGNVAFLGCTSLLVMDFPASVRTVGAYAFADCASLTEARFAEGVREIGYGAFRNCESLRAVILPASLGSIGDDTFEGVPAGLAVTALSGSYARQYAEQKAPWLVVRD